MKNLALHCSCSCSLSSHVQVTEHAADAEAIQEVEALASTNQRQMCLHECFEVALEQCGAAGLIQPAIYGQFHDLWGTGGGAYV